MSLKLPTALALCLALAAPACREEPRAAPARGRPLLVEAAAVSSRDVEIAIEAVGTVEASRRVEIRPQVDGVVAEIGFTEGERVEKGQVLVRLDDSKAAARLALARAALDSARARLDVAAQQLERHRQLIANHLVSEEEFDRVAAEHRAAAAAVREQEAAVELAARELADYTLRAPFDGIVGALGADPGNYVERGTTLVTLIDDDPVHVRLGIPERYADRIHEGMPVEIAAPATDRVLSGTIDFIDPRVDPASRMLTVRAVVANPEGLVRDGQFVRARLIIEVHPNQPVVPEQAIVAAAGKNWVFVVEQGRAWRREVVTGERLPPFVEILRGVRAGERVVTAGQHRLSDGSPVEEVAAEARPEPR